MTSYKDLLQQILVSHHNCYRKHMLLIKNVGIVGNTSLFLILERKFLICWFKSIPPLNKKKIFSVLKKESWFDKVSSILNKNISSFVFFFFSILKIFSAILKTFSLQHISAFIKDIARSETDYIFRRTIHN